MTSSVRTAIGAALLDALALVLPVRCSGCGAPDRAVCEACAQAFAGEPLRRSVGDSLLVISAASYDGTVAAIVAAFKDAGRLDAAPVLGATLRQTIGHALLTDPSASGAIGPLLLVPVPGSRSAMRRRGFSPVERIARAARLPLTRALTAKRQVADQRRLGATQRAVNVVGAFVARRDLTSRRCIIVDDVVTTGSTLVEAQRALSAAGATVVFAVTIAATPISRPNRGSAQNPG